MKNLNQFLVEELNDSKKKKYQKELDNLLATSYGKDSAISLDPNKEVYSIWRSNSKKELHIYVTKSYDELLNLWLQSKEDPKEFGRYLSFQKDKNSTFSVCNNGPWKNFKEIDHTKK